MLAWTVRKNSRACLAAHRASRTSSNLPTITLAILIGLQVGIVVSRPGFSLFAVALTALVVLLAGRLLRYATIPVIALERLCCWLAFATGFFGVALFPIDLGPFSLFPFRIFLLALWVLFAIRVLTLGGKLTLPQRQIRFYLLFFGIWLGYAVLSLGWARSTTDVVRHISFLAMGFSMAFFTSYYFHNDRDLRRLFWLWLGMFGVLLLIGLWEHLTGQHLQISGYHEEKLSALEYYVRADVMYRPTGVFNNPNDYATFLALSIPFGLSLARYCQKLWLRAFGVAGILLSGYFILVTGSRGSLVTVLLELAFLWFFLVQGAWRLKWAATLVGMVGVVLMVAPTPARVILANASNQLASILYDMPRESGSIYVRWNLVKNGLLFVYSNGGFGVGAGNAEHWMANFAHYDTFGILNPHNWWLELLINYGVFIFAGYILFYVGLIRELWRAYKNTDGAQRMICESLLLSLVGLSIASVSPSSIMAFTPQWLLFAFTLAFLNGWRRSQGRSSR